MPAIFKMQKNDKADVFIGPGIVVEFLSGSTKGEFDIDSWDEEKLKQMQKLDNFKVDTSRFEEINGKKWIVLDGETDVGQGAKIPPLKTRVYITTRGGVFFRFTGGATAKEFTGVSDSLQIMVSSLKENGKK
jgi:hypothetical protein